MGILEIGKTRSEVQGVGILMHEKSVDFHVSNLYKELDKKKEGTFKSFSQVNETFKQILSILKKVDGRITSLETRLDSYDQGGN